MQRRGESEKAVCAQLSAAVNQGAICVVPWLLLQKSERPSGAKTAKKQGLINIIFFTLDEKELVICFGKFLCLGGQSDLGAELRLIVAFVVNFL